MGFVIVCIYKSEKLVKGRKRPKQVEEKVRGGKSIGIMQGFYHAKGSCKCYVLWWTCMFAEAGLGSNGSACQMLQIFKQPGYLKQHTTLSAHFVPHIDTYHPLEHNDQRRLLLLQV